MLDMEYFHSTISLLLYGFSVLHRLASKAMGAIFSSDSHFLPKIHYPEKPAYFTAKRISADGLNLQETEKVSLQTFVEARVPSLRYAYRPPWWLFSGHLQTLYCVIGDFSKADHVTYERKILRLVDGGTIGVDFAPPFLEQEGYEPERPLIVFTHGLTGGSYESYLRAIVAPACKPVSEGGLGYRVAVVNFRGCAGIPLTSAQLYSAGHTDDLRQAVMYITRKYPRAPLLGVGYSLGANVMTRYLSEEGKDCRIRAGCVMGCPWDLNANNNALQSGFFARNIYAKGLGTNLQNLIKINESTMRTFPDRNCAKQVDVVLNFKGSTLEDFDNAMTKYLGGSDKPHGPFPLNNAQEYYTWASSHEIVANMAIPFLSINAQDDPVVRRVPMGAGGSGWATMVLTARGGHLGWFESDDLSGKLTRWFKKPVLEWLRACGDGMVHEGQRGRDLHMAGGFLKEVGDDRAHLGCKELDGGGIIVGTDGVAGVMAGL